MSNDDDYDGEISTSPVQIAIRLQSLKAKFQALNEDYSELKQRFNNQEEEVELLKKFKSDFKTGTRVVAILGGFTISLLGAIAAFISNMFSGKGFHWIFGG